jgi:Ala-tRNA(Pro) deacylase
MKQRVLDFLREAGISYRWVDHPPVFTVEESLRELGEEDKCPIKNLLLEERKGERKLLVIMGGEQKLDTKLLSQRLGCGKLRFASADILEQTLGVKPGSVSIFGLLHEGSKQVEVVIDQALLKADELGFHPNDNTATLFISPRALEQITKLTGHKIHTLALY